MPPEQEARERAVYDHESDERSRRRRPAADWGVGEDLFDRMPSRRFKRAHHQEVVIRRADAGAEAVWVDEGPVAAEWLDESAEAPREGEPRRVVATEAPARAREDESPRRADDKRRTRRPVESWLDDDALPLVRGESRTIVLSQPDPDPEAEPAAPPARRTIKISGHPDRLPVARTQRPPRTAVERIGASPDRIAAYAVALGFLLVLIAVLTTGQ
jgi:hypothetical protein